MKKNLTIVFCLMYLLLASVLSACSYQELKPDDTAEQTPNSLLHEERSEEEQKEKTSEPEKSDQAMSSSMNKTASQLVEKDKPGKPSSDSSELFNEQEISEQEREALSEGSASKTKQMLSVSGESKQSQSVSDWSEETIRNKEMSGSKSEPDAQNDEEEAQKSGKKYPVSDDTGNEDKDRRSSDFKWMPEELDDGSKGDLSNSADTPLLSEENKAGNSNINRKGRDTYLMEDGKPKRFWNLQRQLSR